MIITTVTVTEKYEHTIFFYWNKSSSEVIYNFFKSSLSNGRYIISRFRAKGQMDMQKNKIKIDTNSVRTMYKI